MPLFGEEGENQILLLASASSEWGTQLGEGPGSPLRVSSYASGPALTGAEESGVFRSFLS